MEWEVEEKPSFPESVDMLPDEPQVAEALTRLIMVVGKTPLAAPVIEGADQLRVLRTRPAPGGGPPLRLFYSVEGTKVFLWHIERDDESAD